MRSLPWVACRRRTCTWTKCLPCVSLAAKTRPQHSEHWSQTTVDCTDRWQPATAMSSSSSSTSSSSSSSWQQLHTPSNAVWKLTFSNSPSKPLPCCPPSDCQRLWVSTTTECVCVCVINVCSMYNNNNNNIIMQPCHSEQPSQIPTPNHHVTQAASLNQLGTHHRLRTCSINLHITFTLECCRQRQTMGEVKFC